jgi:hypothetical protein
MDKIVQQAMAKWPNVPHCYGWLLLDARGAWRMRDERAQASNLPGDRITNPALLQFIHRNYTHDAKGQWFFQNGPQRVYVDLEATPFILHTDPAHGLMLHTGEPFTSINSVWMTERGEFLLAGSERIAMLDDRDLAQCMDDLRIGNDVPSEEQLVAWLHGAGNESGMTWTYQGHQYPLGRILREELTVRFGFILRPDKNISLGL